MSGTAPDAAALAVGVPPKELREGDRVEATVTGLVAYGAFVVTREGHRGLIHISEISDWYVEDVRDYFRVGEVVTVEVVGREERTGKYAFSTRRVGGKQPLRQEPRGSRRDAGPRSRPVAHPRRGPAGDEQLIAEFVARRVGQLGVDDRQQLRGLVARHGGVRVALALAGTGRRFPSASALIHWVAKQLEPRRHAGIGSR